MFWFIFIALSLFCQTDSEEDRSVIAYLTTISFFILSVVLFKIGHQTTQVTYSRLFRGLVE